MTASGIVVRVRTTGQDAPLLQFHACEEYMESDFGVKQPAGVPSGAIPGARRKKNGAIEKEPAASGQNALQPMRKRSIGCAQPYRQKQVGSTAFLF
jgi:hypothetical protein